MTKFELWLLRKLFKKAMQQGYADQRLGVVFVALYEELFKYYTEDNKPTLVSFVSEIETKAIDTAYKNVTERV